MNVTHGQGELLAQLRPSVTTPVTLFTAVGLRAELTLIWAAVVPGTAGLTQIDIFHDDDGTTYDSTTLIESIQRSDNDESLLFQAQHPGSGILVKPGGSIGVQIDNANAVNFSVYGITETLAERLRPRG